MQRQINTDHNTLTQILDTGCMDAGDVERQTLARQTNS